MDLNKIITDVRLPIFITGMIIGIIFSLVVFSISSKFRSDGKNDSSLTNINSSELSTNSAKDGNSEALIKQLKIGNDFLNQQKYDNAIEVYKKILQQKPSAAGAINNLAVAYFHKNDLENSRKTLENAVTITSQTPFDNLVALYSYMAELSYSKVKTGIDLRNNSNNIEKDTTPNKITLKISDSLDNTPPAIVLAQVKKTSDNPTPEKENGQINNINPLSDNTINVKPVVLAQPKPTPNTIPNTTSDNIPKPIETTKVVTQTKSPAIVKAVVEDKPIVKNPVEAVDKKNKEKDNGKKKNEDDKKNIRLEIFLTLSNWAGSWSAKDLPKYYGFYAQNFKPNEGGNIAEWKKIRKERIESKNVINIKIANLKIANIENDNSLATVTFSQKYQADSTTLNATKKMLMVKEAGSWRILEENVK